jgi:hypothetical protein
MEYALKEVKWFPDKYRDAGAAKIMRIEPDYLL